MLSRRRIRKRFTAQSAQFKITITNEAIASLVGIVLPDDSEMVELKTRTRMRKLITEGVERRARYANYHQQLFRKVTVAGIFIILLATVAQAQNPGPFYRQFNFNPYLFNPAYVGINNQIEASVAYRQQWATFKDSPVTAGASFQLPQSDRVALGFNMMTDKQVLLQHSNVMATFGYVVPITHNQTIRFGLSGGVGPTTTSTEILVWYILMKACGSDLPSRISSSLMRSTRKPSINSRCRISEIDCFRPAIVSMLDD
jgi:hypothetical protein